MINLTDPLPFLVLHQQFPWFFTVVWTLLGALAGSYLNVCAYRVPLGLKTHDPKRSFCPHCKTPIAWYDNIPILSWLVLAGRCRPCKAPIPLAYWFTEFIMCALFFLGAYSLPFAAVIPTSLLLACLLYDGRAETLTGAARGPREIAITLCASAVCASIIGVATQSAHLEQSIITFGACVVLYLTSHSEPLKRKFYWPRYGNTLVIGFVSVSIGAGSVSVAAVIGVAIWLFQSRFLPFSLPSAFSALIIWAILVLSPLCPVS